MYREKFGESFWGNMLSGYKYIDCLKHLSVRDVLDGGVLHDDDIKPLRKILKILKDSPTAGYLIDQVISYDFKISIDEDLSWDESGFEKSTSTLLVPKFSLADLKTAKHAGRLLATMASALRRALKVNQGHNEQFDLKPLDFLRLNRVVEADIDAVTVQICWELRTAGDASAWRQILAGDHGDIAVVFANAMKTYPMGQFDGKALRAAFRQWFADCARTNDADHMALEYLDMALAYHDQYDITADRNLDENDLRKIQKNLPFPNYLENMNIKNSWFDGLKDPFNQVHLHHILDELKSLPR